MEERDHRKVRLLRIMNLLVPQPGRWDTQLGKEFKCKMENTRLRDEFCSTPAWWEALLVSTSFLAERGNARKKKWLLILLSAVGRLW